MTGTKRVARSLTIVTLLIIALVLLAPALSSAAPPAASAPQHVTLTWTGDPCTTQTITWHTSALGPRGRVEYAAVPAGSGLPMNAAAVVAAGESLLTDGGKMIIHSATLTGLRPGTRYIYRVGGDAGWSEPRGFKTAPGELRPFAFLVFGDTQGDRYDGWRALLRRAYETNHDAAFFTAVGDLVDVGQDYEQWAAWLGAAQEIIGVIPVMPLTGNHEYYTPLWGERSLPAMFTALFKLPGNGPQGLKGQAYSFDYGDVHFVMLDSQAREGARFLPDMLDRQKAWLEKDLAATNKRWKVAFVHKPPYNSKTARGNDDVKAAFVPILERYLVDVVFSGHEHVYARTYTLRDDGIAADRAEGTIYVTTGRGGDKSRGKARAGDWHEVYHNPSDEPNYLVAKVAGNVLSVEVFKLNGELIDSWVIEKER
jgi:hypothetical protein